MSATKSTNPARKSTTPTVTFKSKSDWARHMFNRGLKVAEIEKISNDVAKRKEFNYPADETTGMGYSFIFGIAKRAKIEATGGRKVKSVKVTEEFVTVIADSGKIVQVNRATGEVKYSGVKTPAVKSTKPEPKSETPAE